jgi:nucleotide-binding universal stress UspA family protein
VEPRRSNYIDAIHDFRSARQKAALEQVLGWIRGEPSDLLSYEQVSKLLRARGESPTILKEIPLDSIVGSVGRYRDFSRSFLPRDEGDESRWARVKSLTEGMDGLPPIEVYQIGESYFVKDGHHRVSVARELGSEVIEAYVTPVQTRVQLQPEDDPSDIILKAEAVEFLEKTRMDEIRPDARLELTEAGCYLQLEQDLRLHHENLTRDREEDVAWEQAVGHWFEHVYMPVARVIHSHGMLRDFPGRTETDLYLWLRSRQAELKQHLGWDVTPDQAADDLAEMASTTPSRIVSRLSERLWAAFRPEELASGPPAGDWRRRVLAKREDRRLFPDVIVPIRGDELGWKALEQAIEVAKRESGRLHGLHVRSRTGTSDLDHEEAMRSRFARNCRGASVDGILTFSEGLVSSEICHHSRWADLAVMILSYPPSTGSKARLGSGVRRLIRSCPRPLMMTPGDVSLLDQPLLAYDSSPKSDEALFIAAYMASAWGARLTVVSVDEPGHDAGGSLERAQQYLAERDLRCDYRSASGDPAQVILEHSQEVGADLILMGGYGANPLLEAVMGSTVDEVLRRSHNPLLMCR